MVAGDDLDVETHVPNGPGLEFSLHDSHAMEQRVDSHRSAHYTNLLWSLLEGLIIFRH